MESGAPTVEAIKNAIRDVPDFPKPGIIFKDITPLLQSPNLLDASMKELAAPYRDAGIEAVVGIDARGFIFATGVALELGAGFVPVRKAGKLPYETIEADYELEYGSSRVAIHKDALRPGAKIALVDDLLATGGTSAAAIRLLETLDAEIVGISFLIELGFLGGRERFANHPIHSLIQY